MDEKYEIIEDLLNFKGIIINTKDEQILNAILMISKLFPFNDVYL